MKSISILPVVFVTLVLVIALIPSTFAFGHGWENESHGNQTNASENESMSEPWRNENISEWRNKNVSDWAKENVEYLKDRFVRNKEFRNNIKRQIQECKENTTQNGECKTVRKVATKIAKGLLLRVCSKNENISDMFERRIDNAKLSDEEKATLKETLQQQKDKLQDLCSKVQDADSNETREIVKETRDLMKGTNLKLKIAKQLIILHRMGLIIERAEHLETNLDRVMEKFECNTTDLGGLKEQFNSQIAEARSIYNESQGLWGQFKESVKNKEPNVEILKKAQVKMQEAQAKLKEAHFTLKEIILELRSCKQGMRNKTNETNRPGDNETGNESSNESNESE